MLKSIKWGLFGLLIGFLITIISFIAFSHNFDWFIINLIIYPIYKLSSLIDAVFYLCPAAKSECIYRDLEVAVFFAPIFYGFFGLIIGLIIDKIKKK
ncbi:MAG TPA: hypothetical protein VJJ52_06615 [Candidatus Nanoarchaeia archaeon]|nr:hypothetical protein [Candidatus Nanoarchaeia archaeon]